MKCSRCGTPAMKDTRGGSVEYILVCKCDETGTWVDEGNRGGYYANDVKIVPSREDKGDDSR